MLGKDFFVYWQIGRAVWSGLNPYAVPESLYPPAMLAVFAVMALPPFTVAFATWTGINVAVFTHSLARLVTDKRRLLWFAFPPVLFVLLTGQLDLLVLWASTFLARGGYAAAMATAFITLKPQAAFIVLPWYLLRWWKTDRGTLGKAVALSAAVHLAPLIAGPSLYSDWISSVRSQSAWRLEASPGLFALTGFGVPWVPIAIVALAAAIWSLTRNRQTSWAAQLCALPSGLWYEGVFLSGVVPAALILPVAWLAFLAAAAWKVSWPLAVVPIVALARSARSPKPTE